jgi:hypothetical protein
MHAREGDRIVVHGRTLGQPDRGGVVREVKPARTGTMYRVGWDDGAETMFMPSAGVAEVIRAGAPAMADEVRLGCQVELTLTEDRDSCTAIACLTTPRGTFRTQGEAHRHPEDPDVPMIGEELAIGRALTALGDLLMAEAADALADRETRPIHLIAN